MSGTLNEGEFHPAAHIAWEYVKKFLADCNTFSLIETLSSTAIAGNRLAEVSLETLQRILKGEPVSDRYLMGLAWMLWRMSNEGKAHAGNEPVGTSNH